MIFKSSNSIVGKYSSVKTSSLHVRVTECSYFSPIVGPTGHQTSATPLQTYSSKLNNCLKFRDVDILTLGLKERAITTCWVLTSVKKCVRRDRGRNLVVPVQLRKSVLRRETEKKHFGRPLLRHKSPQWTNADRVDLLKV